jgi:Pentapeptide repeats (8 copies)
MANDEHVAILKKGAEAWKAWRDKNPNIVPDLCEANLDGADISGANLGLADLSWAELSGANLHEASLESANLNGANLSDADLSVANLVRADLYRANLNGANLSRASLQTATLVGTYLAGADLTGCRIYGVSAWGLILERAKQQNLVITDWDEPAITVDDIEVAQFIYLMLRNQKIHNLIDTITAKAVLILGRFTDERKKTYAISLIM